MGYVGYNIYNGISPPSIVTPLRYVETYNITEAVTGFNFVVMRANSVFDPYDTGAGHQPLGFDQWAAIYAQYRVLRCKIKVDFHQNQSTVPALVGITPSESNGTLIGSAAEQPGSVYTMLAPEGSGNTCHTLYNSMDIVKYEGDYGSKYDDRNSALVTASPSEGKFFHVWSLNPTGASSVDTVATVTLDYMVEFFNKKPQSAS